MFEQMLGARPAVAIEIEVYELRRNRTLAAGLRLPTSTELFALARNPVTGADIRIPALPLSSGRIGTPQLGITLGDAQLLANLLNTMGSRVQRAETRQCRQEYFPGDLPRQLPIPIWDQILNRESKYRGLARLRFVQTQLPFRFLRRWFRNGLSDYRRFRTDRECANSESLCSISLQERPTSINTASVLLPT